MEATTAKTKHHHHRQATIGGLNGTGIGGGLQKWRKDHRFRRCNAEGAKAVQQMNGMEQAQESVTAAAIMEIFPDHSSCKRCGDRAGYQPDDR